MCGKMLNARRLRVVLRGRPLAVQVAPAVVDQFVHRRLAAPEAAW